MERGWVASYEEGIAPEIEIPETSLPLLLEETARRSPNRAAIQFLGSRMEYHELWEQVRRLAGSFRSMGISSGARVALYLPNCPQFVLSYYALQLNGAIPMLISPLAVERELRYQISDARAAAIITLDQLAGTVKEMLQHAPLDHVILTGIDDYLPPLKRFVYRWVQRFKGRRFPRIASSLRLKELLRGEPVDLPGPNPDSDAVLIYTGGTTGEPRGVQLTHRNLVANTSQVQAWFTRIQFDQEVILTALPLFHVFGMTVCMNLGAAIGATLVLVPRFDVNLVLDLIDRHKATMLPGVPTMYVAINNADGLSERHLKSLRYCISGGAALPLEVRREFERLTGARLVEGYGLTESSPVCHVNPFDGRDRAGSIGLPVPNTDARIVDLETGSKDMSVGEPGELVIRGPQVMKGYLGRNEETARTIRDGWLYTGDIAKRDKDGFFYILDRKKELIIASGFNISPREVDEVLYEHPKIKEAAVVGIQDEYRGETVKAFVVPKDNIELSEAEVIDFCRDRLAAYKVPKIIEFRLSLPKSPIGKILRRRLLEEEQKIGDTESEGSDETPDR